MISSDRLNNINQLKKELYTSINIDCKNESLKFKRLFPTI